ncbi:DUF2169 domain-containing protein [Lelliottia sp. V106_10]|uniref:DUF2169 family type VI secretion system accessory protein n=1 Tax=Lelliottia wanjuensis TaxID=3050585 RepID=UPI00254CF765|nr:MULTISPECIES: DUF2169 domain-containing protein [unclassified Lelliottia]MDK9354891.1 DUF2169 domain-containing protein [Lelliottia sp. V106_16]MDK9372099.1 DUF2169 domain-containing protein [Lelliottia sp. V106_10]MDK9598735.1 DUF2169 domain-containing protein [Lelliottia sp. V106_5]
MEFRNLTPFSVMEYAMDDKHNDRHRVVVMKTGFRLKQDECGVWQAELMENPPLPLCMEDEFSGEINRSSVLRESDLAPLKPACDIIINGTAYTPDGVPAPEMTAGVLMRTASGDVLLDKKLRVTGKHFYQRQALTGQWYKTEPEPFTSLELDYRFAFGGECRVEDDNTFADRLPEEYRLNEQQRREHPDKVHPPLAHTACPVNPLGKGYMQAWHQNACNIQQVEAPRITFADSPFTLKQFTACLEGKADWHAPEFQPAGFGVIGRTWWPRLAMAGTYDQAWLETQHPALPNDFDFGYWNCASRDQQIPHPPQGITLTLNGLHPDGDITFALPANQAVILLRMQTGEWVPQLMWVDTLHIDTRELTVAQTWRYLLPSHSAVRVMEARYSISGE